MKKPPKVAHGDGAPTVWQVIFIQRNLWMTLFVEPSAGPLYQTCSESRSSIQELRYLNFLPGHRLPDIYIQCPVGQGSSVFVEQLHRSQDMIFILTGNGFAKVIQ